MVPVDIAGPHSVRRGDIFVLCTDGLSGRLADEEIGAIVRSLRPAEACHFLVHLANLRGGVDNITAIVIRITRSDTARRDAVKTSLAGVWPLAALILGILLAAGSTILALVSPTSGLPVLLLAAVVIVTGIVGLAVQYVHEKQPRQTAESVTLSKPLIHRQVSCQIGKPLVSKFAETLANLQQQAHQEKWDVNWEAYRQHFESAGKHLAKNDFPAAFPELCRALQPLTEALAKQRQKQEVFKPVWDKKKS